MGKGGRREEAVQLRLAGWSRSQIADALGLAGGGQPLSRWLRGVPPPAWTRRPRAKDDLREMAVAMRKEGRSYREIREVVAVSKSTLSLWLRDVPLTEEQQLALALRGPAATTARWEANRANKARHRLRVQAEARAQIAELSESELFVAGVVAYWAEGTKNKPWRHGQSVKFMNSDPQMIRLFLAWLRLIGVPLDRLIFRVHIHQSADVVEAVTFWSDVVGAPMTQFRKCTIKTHNPKTIRRNVGAGYHGCLLVYVRNSAELNLQIDGWCQGLASAVQDQGAG
ncbi:MAG TPA: hypothetical protein VHF91_08675 [Acidimicrobiales bacterium]|nr:hypothetical protein [Acidimicrobiales bacterium]